ncbi:MAG TPA: hypothetical protein GX513_00220 [Firmicutes bacterium]|nr:hypothetical protein [Bacillota bacterium]
MATVRQHLQCEVCGKVTLLRTQLGWLQTHPIRIHCGNCNILISGTVYLNPKLGTWRFEFYNAQVVSDAEPDFYVESSGELLTAKVQPYEGDAVRMSFIAPFFHSALWPMGERYHEFKARTISFLGKIGDWPRVRRINELWREGKHQFLAQEVHRYLPPQAFPMNNELEYLRGIRHVNVMFFGDLMDMTEPQQFIGDSIIYLVSKATDALTKLATDFKDSGLLEHYESSILERLEQFIEIFPFLIPVFGLNFYKRIPENLAQEKGITTASLEDLKQFYLDSYENLADMVRLLVACNNLYHRGEHEAMQKRRSDVRTLGDYDRIKSKGEKLEFLDGTEHFDGMISPKLNGKVRNAIAHNSYDYDGVKQVLAYYPRGRQYPDQAQRMFFLDFARSCWGLFTSLMALSELVYQTRRVYYLAKGIPPYPCAQ